jgi:hypothetical protein
MPNLRKKSFSSFKLRDALQMVGINQLKDWQLDIVPKPPSDLYRTLTSKLKFYFDLSLSEAAKSLLIDAILLEAMEGFHALKIWKEASLQTDTLTGTIDYLIAPQGKVYQSPLLCVVEAKKDNFEQGLAQCLVEMQACRWYNQGLEPFDLYGIVTNANVWQFYKLTPANEGYESPIYADTQLETILGILQQILTQVTVNLTVRKSTSGGLEALAGKTAVD